MRAGRTACSLAGITGDGCLASFLLLLLPAVTGTPLEVNRQHHKAVLYKLSEELAFPNLFSKPSFFPAIKGEVVVFGPWTPTEISPALSLLSQFPTVVSRVLGYPAAY